MKPKTVNVYVCGVCASEEQEVSRPSGPGRPWSWSVWIVQEAELDMCGTCTKELARWRANRIYDAVKAKREAELAKVVAMPGAQS